jgi:hypothetical protein
MMNQLQQNANTICKRTTAAVLSEFDGPHPLFITTRVRRWGGKWATAEKAIIGFFGTVFQFTKLLLYFLNNLGVRRAALTSVVSRASERR